MKKTFKLKDMPLQGFSYNAKLLSGDGGHKHIQAQLLYCSYGSFEVEIDEKIFLVPPNNAIWVPSNMKHNGRSKRIVHHRSIYFDTRFFKALPTHMHVVGVSNLLKELIEKACQFDTPYTTSSAEYRLAKVIVDEIKTAEVKAYHLPLPTQNTLKRIHEFLFTHLSNPMNSDYIAKHFAMSEKTLNRLCKEHLGMTIGVWRQQIKLLKAIEMLSYNKPTTQITQKLGYSNDSAFIARFKHMTGMTPSHFKARNSF